MDVSSQDPSLMAMDLSKSYNPLTRSHTDAMDLAKKPEWYHRRPQSCGTSGPSYRSRASSSYNSLSTQPGPPVHCRDMEQGPEALDDYMSSTLAPGLDLYHDRVHGNLWHPGFYGPDQSSGPVPESSGGEESDSGSDVIFLVSSAKEPLICSSFIQDSGRHIVEPLSPAVSSLDEGRGCYHLPQPLSSPSPDSSYSDDSSDSSVDIPVHHARPVVLLSDLTAVYGNQAESPVDISSDDSDVIEVSVTNEKKKSHNCRYKKNAPRKKSARRESQSEADKSPPAEVRRSPRIKKPVSETPMFTCSVSRHSLRRQAKNNAVGIYNESCDSDDMMEYMVRLSSPEPDERDEPNEQDEPDKPASQPDELQSASSNSEESDEDVRTEEKSAQKEQPPSRKASFTQSIKRKKPLVIQKTKKLRRTKQKEKHKPSPQQRQQKPKASSVNKKTVSRRMRKKQSKSQIGPSALFPPTEPEIKLKYANIKEKKDKKSDGFCPFVHVEQRMCTVVNYQEEAATVRSSRGGQQQQQTAARTLSGFVPSTSCFQLGRLSSESRCQAALLCCLCGQTANVTGLGDLHGPYYPSSPAVDCQSCRTEQREEDNSRGRLTNSHSLNSSSDVGSAVESLHDGDRNSLPKVPLHLDECWIHEDCGIWSNGVFLVRGKLYGLVEAARLARETVSDLNHDRLIRLDCFFVNTCDNFRCFVLSNQLLEN